MPIYTFDTSFIISRTWSDIPDHFLLSDVVIMELMAAAPDESTFRTYQKLRKSYQDDNLLITPDADDWLMASKVLFWLEQGKRKNNRGKAPPKRPGATQRMALDALIAVSARRYKATVVTENFDDFDAIKYYCDFRLMRGAEFLDK